MQLRKVQTNELYDIIKSYDLSPGQFKLKDLKEIGSDGISIELRNKPEFYFLITDPDTSSFNYYIKYSPSSDTHTVQKSVSIWRHVIAKYKDWLESLINEIEAPDRWKRLEQEIKNISLTYQPNEEKFTDQEFEEIKDRIKLIEERIKEIGLSLEQFEIINNKLDYLIEKGKTMSRSDWKSMFIGSIINLVIQLNINVGYAKALWRIIEETFKQLFLN